MGRAQNLGGTDSGFDFDVGPCKLEYSGMQG